MRTLIASTLFPVLALATAVCVASGAGPAPASAALPVAALPHCQVPCGIYGDRVRIDLLMEDAATIEKAMGEIAKPETVVNQAVRWVVTKDQHAAAIQDQVASYWLAQRVKPLAADASEADRAAYHKRLELLHGITVAAMKCKQTTEATHVATVRSLALEFSSVYFTGEDLEHIRGHHSAGSSAGGGEHR